MRKIADASAELEEVRCQKQAAEERAVSQCTALSSELTRLRIEVEARRREVDHALEEARRVKSGVATDLRSERALLRDASATEQQHGAAMARCQYLAEEVSRTEGNNLEL